MIESNLQLDRELLKKAAGRYHSYADYQREAIKQIGKRYNCPEKYYRPARRRAGYIGRKLAAAFPPPPDP